MRLDGKVALITGSSRGIGRAIAVAFAREGANIVVNYVRSKERAEKVVTEIRSFGVEAMAVRADVSNITEVEGMVKECVKQFRSLDILVNNAADFSVMELSLEKPDWNGWQRMVDVNVKGILTCSHVSSRYMLKQEKGNIINIVADWPGGGLGYMLTKSAGIPLTKGLARALAPNIRVNAVCPGSIDTGWISSLSEEKREKLKQTIPLKRWGQPEDVAKVTVFLASEESSFMTGTVVVVDGGGSVNPWTP